MDSLRGDETRSWIQVVTDTLENQRAEKVDEVFEIVGGEKRRLENRDNADLYRLYEWTLPPSTVTGDATGVVKRAETRVVGGKELACNVESGGFVTPEGEVPVEFVTCPDFLWTNTDARIGTPDAPLWTRSVAAFGRH